MSFAQRTKAVKARRGMTTEELSRKSGVPQSTLNKILTGVIEEPKLSVAQAIAQALGCPLGLLLDGTRDFTDTMSEEEMELVRKFRRLDGGSRDLLEMVVERELKREESAAYTVPEVEEVEEVKMLTLPLYVLPASAGRGSFLDENEYYETIDVRATRVSLGADYAVKVQGNSMEPMFDDGDILLVRRQQSVEIGDLGIFVGDGEGYFKRYIGRYLRSFNPAYADILISNFSEFRCYGKVIGQMKRRLSRATT